MLKVNTIDKPLYFLSPPNGGWGWMVMVAGFCVYGNANGMSKSLGIYFLDIKHEFGVSNSETSWISSLSLGATMMAGLLTSVLPSWLDARKTVICGGLLACCGMILSAFSFNIWSIYVGSFLAGTGHGIAAVTVIAQVSLYFSTHRPLATGIMMSGSSVGSTTLPYFNHYLLENYGWRGSFWILAALGLNTCVLGALIRPIEIVSIEKCSKNENEVPEENDIDIKIEDSKSLPKRISAFFSTYWVALCLLFAMCLLHLPLLVPNIFLVPYAQALGYSPDDATLLLSFISIGDIICRPLNGFLMSHFNVLLNHILLYIAALCILLSLDQLIAVFSLNFAFLVAYTVIHGIFIGFIVTAGVTAVPTLMGTKNISKLYGIFFAAGSITLLPSAPFAGIFVDTFNDYKAAYWYCVIGFSTTGIFCFIMYVVVKTRGGVVKPKGVTAPGQNV